MATADDRLPLTMYDELAEVFGPGAELELLREAEQTSMVVLVGATGAGKSFFINAVAPGSCVTSSRLASCKSCSCKGN